MADKHQLQQNPGFFRQLGEFMLANKKWWLAPIVVVVVMLGFLMVLGGTSAAPFIYSLF